MTAPVYFTSMRATADTNLSRKIALLAGRAGLQELIAPGDITAVKIHFGEQGNTAFIRPIYIRDIIDAVTERRAIPFLTDTNSLYRGEREQAVSHITTALRHGFSYATVGCPIIIADGLRGNDAVCRPVAGACFSEVSLARAIVEADALVCVSHVKGHELTGFGGALKNLGMGCASREGKLKQHSTIAPTVQPDICIRCGRCRACCPAEAIMVGDAAAAIDASRCIGCARCITACPVKAIKIVWDESSAAFQKRMIDYARGAVDALRGKALYVNFLVSISPACDCYGYADSPIVPDIGICAATDPVAIDEASVDLINAQPGIFDSALTCNHEPGRDKFRALYPDVDWSLQLDYAQTLGMGSRSYELIRI